MAGKSNGVDSMEWARAPPKKLPLGERVLRAVYDPDDKTFLGRTPKRWGIMVIFYLIFYIVLALLFAICMGGLFMCLNDDKPMYTLEKSLIGRRQKKNLLTGSDDDDNGSNPGVTFRPRPRDEVTVQYSTDNSTGYDTYVQELREFIQPYINESWYIAKTECNHNDNFGYPDTPCFFLKLNKVYGWKPDFYRTDADLPADMTLELANYIRQVPDNENNQIWVSCLEEATNSTRIEYPWGRGLPGSFYPYLNQRDYTSPLIAIKIIPPSTSTLVIVRCRAWAKNIVYNKSLKEASGYARIQLLVDSAGNTTDKVL